MYENESAVVRLGIEFLQAMTEEDYLLDPTFDVLDLERELNEIQADSNHTNRPHPGKNEEEARHRLDLLLAYLHHRHPHCRRHLIVDNCITLSTLLDSSTPPWTWTQQFHISLVRI